MAVDANFSDVSLLMHFDGPNDSTIFTDSSGRPKTVTRIATAKISTAQSVFGGASFFSNESGITVPSSSDFDVSTGDFSIEMRVRPSGLSGSGILINKANGTGSDYPFQAYVRSDGGLMFLSYSGAAALFTVSTSAGLLSVGNWAAVQFNRAGSTFRVFVNGAQVGSSTYSGALPTNSFAVSIGSYSDNSFRLNGHIDELRFTKGLARNTSSYTPSTEAFPEGVTYRLRGIVRDASNAYAARKVSANREDTGLLVGMTVSDGVTGAYEISTQVSTAHTLVFYPADGESLNALILRGVVPVEA